MASWGIGRTSRRYPPAAPPAADPALMPPPSQGAERRGGSRRGTWLRRIVVVGGLAGAAWLLSGTAAHAADRDPAGDGPGLLGPAVTHELLDPLTAHRDTGALGGRGRTVVGDVLHAAVRPRDGARRPDLTAVLTAPAAAADRAVEAAGDTLAHAADTGDVVRRVTTTTAVPSPAPARPAGAGVRAAGPPDTAADRHPDDRPGGTPAAGRPAAGTAGADAVPAPARTTTGTTARTDGPAATGRDATAPAGRHAAPVRRWHAVAAVPAATARHHPGGDGPAWPRSCPGTGVLPAGGPGAPTDGGPAVAVLPAAAGGAPVHRHRPPHAADVAARCSAAGDPAVSPD